MDFEKKAAGVYFKLAIAVVIKISF